MRSPWSRDSWSREYLTEAAHSALLVLCCCSWYSSSVNKCSLAVERIEVHVRPLRSRRRAKSGRKLLKPVRHKKAIEMRGSEIEITTYKGIGVKKSMRGVNQDGDRAFKQAFATCSSLEFHLHLIIHDSLP